MRVRDQSDADAGGRQFAQHVGHILVQLEVLARGPFRVDFARARIETLGSEVGLRLRQIAQRADVSKALASRNDITIQQLLAAVATTSDMQRLIAFDKDGVPIPPKPVEPPHVMRSNAIVSELEQNRGSREEISELQSHLGKLSQRRGPRRDGNRFGEEVG